MRILGNEIYNVLNDLGLDEEEISSVNKRNKLLNETTAAEVEDILNFFSVKCKLKKDDMARVIIKNPLILNESFSRINALSEIYKRIGFSGADYRKYILSYDKAFSLNPKEVLDNISKMMNEGKEIEDIKRIMLEQSNKIFD